MSLAKKLKMIVKGEQKPTFGTDPNEPWSVRAGITESESGMLHAYLKSRGINPEFVSKDTKISHSKSGEFQKWKRDHMFDDPADTVSSVQRDKMKAQREEVEELTGVALDEVAMEKISPAAQDHVTRGRVVKVNVGYGKPQSDTPRRVQKKPVKQGFLKKLFAGEEVEIDEAVDKEDTITFDIPLLIRMFEYAREDAKTDMDLHKVTEKLISIRDKGTLTMADYDFITKLKESVDIIEKNDPCWTGYTQVGMKDKGGREVPNCVPSKGVPKAKGYKQVKEWKTTEGSALDRFRAAASEREKKHNAIEKDHQEKLHQDPSKVTVPAPKTKDGMTSAIDRLEKHLNKEDVYQDSQAATQTAFDMGTQPDNCSCDRKKQMSKSARMIKALYKKHKMVKEDLYDHEKEDKSVATYGKKPKVQKIEDYSDEEQASMVLKGGTTLTGQTRDTLEIDPVMRKANRNNDNKTNK